MQERFICRGKSLVIQLSSNLHPPKIVQDVSRFASDPLQLHLPLKIIRRVFNLPVIYLQQLSQRESTYSMKENMVGAGAWSFLYKSFSNAFHNVITLYVDIMLLIFSHLNNSKIHAIRPVINGLSMAFCNIFIIVHFASPYMKKKLSKNVFGT